MPCPEIRHNNTAPPTRALLLSCLWTSNIRTSTGVDKHVDLATADLQVSGGQVEMGEVGGRRGEIEPGESLRPEVCVWGEELRGKN